MHEVRQYQILHPTPVMQLSVDRVGTLVRGTIVVSAAEHGTAVDALAAQVAILRQHKTDYMEAAEQTKKALAAECQRLREALDGLRKVTTGKIRHAYLGQCPDEVEGFDVRDDECPACRALVIADAALAGSKEEKL